MQDQARIPQKILTEHGADLFPERPHVTQDVDAVGAAVHGDARQDDTGTAAAAQIVQQERGAFGHDACDLVQGGGDGELRPDGGAVLRSQDLGGFRQEDGQEGFERGPQPLRGKMLTIGRQQGALGDGLVLAFPQVAGNEREQGFRPEVMLQVRVDRPGFMEQQAGLAFIFRQQQLGQQQAALARFQRVMQGVQQGDAVAAGLDGLGRLSRRGQLLAVQAQGRGGKPRSWRASSSSSTMPFR